MASRATSSAASGMSSFIRTANGLRDREALLTEYSGGLDSLEARLAGVATGCLSCFEHRLLANVRALALSRIIPPKAQDALDLQRFAGDCVHVDQGSADFYGAAGDIVSAWQMSEEAVDGGVHIPEAQSA